MTAEFTGERVIPGEVDVDLWNEHVARYVFAQKLSSGRRVLDVGCGTGYGSEMLLSAGARSVTALDISADALRYGKPWKAGVQQVQASASELPLRSRTYNLVVAFEVIEHLRDWTRLIAEAGRVLASGGVFVVSTPNKSFYAETRAETGPNPFHEHEFEYDEFVGALRQVFPHTSLFLQDHTEGVAFRRMEKAGDSELRIDHGGEADPGAASFFVAICSDAPLPEVSSLVYVPQTANALREKLRHIARLNGEISKKDGWLAEAQTAHQELLEKHRQVTEELKRSNLWAESLNEKVTAAGRRIVGLQDELEELHRSSQEIIHRYEAELDETRKQLQSRVEELQQCVDILHRTEADLEDRTRWALALDAQRESLEGRLQEAEARLGAVQSSRWVKLGRAIGVGPELVAKD